MEIRVEFATFILNHLEGDKTALLICHDWLIDNNVSFFDQWRELKSRAMNRWQGTDFCPPPSKWFDDHLDDPFESHSYDCLKAICKEVIGI